MKISIITPVFNGEKYIEETIASVLGQDGGLDLEYIIVDGGSTDGTLDILKRYEHRYRQGNYQGGGFKAFSFTYISEADNGMYDALRKGFLMCHGDIVGWINADDFYLAGALKKVCKIFGDNEEINWIAGCCSVVDEKYRYLHKSIMRNYPQDLIRNGGFGLHSDYFIPQESVFWRSTLMKYIDYDVFAGYRLAGDFYLWFTFAEKEHLYSVDESLAVFRKTGCNMSLDRGKYRNEMVQIIKESDTFQPRDYVLIRSYGNQWGPTDNRKEVSFEYIYEKSGRYIKKCRGNGLKKDLRKLTIITICKDNPNVRYTCESIVRQLWNDYEWIVVDGGSTDETMQILGEYRESIDLLISEPDNGIYAAMNKGIKNAHGEWIIFMNGGDQFYDYEVLGNVFQDKEYDASVLYGDEERFEINSQEGEIYELPSYIPPYFMCYRAFAHQAMFYRRTLFEKYGYYDETYKISADSEKNTQLLLGGEKFEKLNMVISSYILDGLSNKEKYQKKLKEERYRCRKKYYSDKEIDLYQSEVYESDIKLNIPIIKVKSYKDGKLKKYYLFGFILLFTAVRVY